jgi:hypothetical protein
MVSSCGACLSLTSSRWCLPFQALFGAAKSERAIEFILARRKGSISALENIIIGVILLTYELPLTIHENESYIWLQLPQAQREG